jgi:hypothetical protein
VTAPTPADVFGQQPRPIEVPMTAVARTDVPPPFFAAVYGGASRSVPAWRSRARDEAAAAADRLARELARLCQRDESDLDLRIESYRRAAARLDDALDAFDDALADPAGPSVPPPAARDI